MKKVSFAKKVLLLLTIPFILSAIFCSCILLERKIDNKLVNWANAGSQSSTSYVDPDIYMKDLGDKYIQLERAYSLDDEYPFFAENQTTSNLCWIYSSMKVLETSLMKQRNEYHNFSDVGTALLYYLNYVSNEPNYDKEKDGSFIDLSGDFTDFNMVTQNYGLIYENAFSNDLFFDINIDNYENYEYILKHVDNRIMDNIKPINIHSSITYTLSSKEIKTTLLKKYIRTYGGFFAGLERGIISSSNSTYLKQDERPGNDSDGYIPTTHAVCIVGWDDDKSAFRALNSWGVEDGKFNYFWIPYSYNFLYDTTYGYICTSNSSVDSDILDLESSAGGLDGFGNKFVGNMSQTMNNLFVYGENFEISYKFSNRFDFQKVFVNIYDGQSLVNSDFNIEFEDTERIVTISVDDPTKISDGYYIEFYYDKEFIGSRDFYVFTGSEVCYVEFISASEEVNNNNTGLILLNNSFSSGIFEQTYYHNEVTATEYYFNMFFPYNYNTGDKIQISIGDIFLTSTDEFGNVSTIQLDEGNQIRVSVASKDDFRKNLRKISIRQMFFNYRNKMIEINVKVKSTITDKEQNYKFSIFVSDILNTTTSQANTIVYELDGGVNNIQNLNRYPNFEKDEQITSINLYEPTKHGSVFRGWYLDKNYTTKIEKIDKNIPILLDKKLNPLTGNYYSGLLNKIYSDDIVIYAKWDSEKANYFDVNLNIYSVTDYNGNLRNLSDDNFKIIYGDSVTSEFVFSPIADDLKTYSYQTTYTYLFNNAPIVVDEILSKDGQIKYIVNSFLNDGKISLVCGDYVISINVTMVVSHQFVINKSISIDYSVYQKYISANFNTDNLRFEYDGNYHNPIVESFNGVYAEDGEIGYTFDNKNQFLVGEYDYTLNSIDNDNYYIDDNQKTSITIYKKNITIDWTITEKTYNGTIQEPSYVLNGVVPIDEDKIQLNFGLTNSYFTDAQMKNVGTYNVSIIKITNNNYNIEDNRSCVFKITPAKLILRFDNKSVRFTISPAIREQNVDYRVTWRIEGTLYDKEEDLNISYSCQGPNSIVSGDYPIVGSYNNSNYDIEIINAVYSVLGQYYVFYTLPDGTEYQEIVQSGDNPKGVEHIDKSIFKKPFMSKIIYDKELVGNGTTDIYITVTIKSYSWVLFISIAILGFVVAYLFVSRKERRNRYR